MKRCLVFVLITGMLTGSGETKDRPIAGFDKARISSVSFVDAELGEVMKFLSSKAEELLKHPVNIILIGDDTGSKTLTLTLNDVPLGTVLKYSCELTGCVVEVLPDGILIGPMKNVLRAKSDWNEARVVAGRGNAASQLAAITIPSLQLNDAAISEVIKFLRSRTEEVALQTSGQVRAPNYVMINNPEVPIDDLTVSLNLKNVQLSSVIRFITAAAGPEVSYRIDHGAVVFGHPADLKMAPQPKVSASPAAWSWMQNKIIPEVDFSDVPLKELLTLVRHYAGNRFNVVNQSKETSGTASLTLKRVSLATLLTYICEQTNTNFRVENRAIIIIAGKKRPKRESTLSPVKGVTSKPGGKGKLQFDK